ncbi:hypothetical protein C8J57DRAFT_1345145 [Mycena rebaudengoi]|nr:hypothetical protein C8J57DRAFT_1345145 [Mycena rebaudengoi]
MALKYHRIFITCFASLYLSGFVLNLAAAPFVYFNILVDDTFTPWSPFFHSDSVSYLSLSPFGCAKFRLFPQCT